MDLVNGYARCGFALCIHFYISLLSFRFRIATFHVGGSDLSDRDVYDIIDMEISRFMREDFPGFISIVREELIVVMDEILRILRA